MSIHKSTQMKEKMEQWEEVDYTYVHFIPETPNVPRGGEVLLDDASE